MLGRTPDTRLSKETGVFGGASVMPSTNKHFLEKYVCFKKNDQKVRYPKTGNKDRSL